MKIFFNNKGNEAGVNMWLLLIGIFILSFGAWILLSRLGGTALASDFDVRTVNLRNMLDRCQNEYNIAMDSQTSGQPIKIIDVDEDKCVDTWDVCIGGRAVDGDGDGVPYDCDSMPEDGTNLPKDGTKRFKQRELCKGVDGEFNDNKQICCIGNFKGYC